MDMDMHRRHGHAPWKWTCTIDMDMHHRHGHAPWTWIWTIYIDINHKYGHAPWKCTCRKGHEHRLLLEETICNEISHAALFRETILNEISHGFYFAKHARFREISTFRVLSLFREIKLYAKNGNPTLAALQLIMKFYNLICKIRGDA
jgi:hypothetical protein